MTRRIEHIVTLDPDDFEALHTIYTNKGNADPIVNVKWTRDFGQGVRCWVASIMAVEAEGATTDGTTS